MGNARQHGARHRGRPYPHRRDSELAIKIEHFKLLAPDALVHKFNRDPDKGEVQIEQVLDDGWTLLAPRWGAVAQFLDKTAAGWYKRNCPRLHWPLYRFAKPSLRSDTENLTVGRGRQRRAGDDRARTNRSHPRVPTTRILSGSRQAPIRRLNRPIPGQGAARSSLSKRQEPLEPHLGACPSNMAASVRVVRRS